YPVALGGITVLLTGVLGAIVLLLYSAGPCPLSSLPIGELAAGITMGGLIPLACTTSFTGTVDYMIFVDSLPIILGIALMMMTNNICDIERDLRVGRKTFPARIGRKKARLLYRLLLLVWAGILAGYMSVRFPLHTRGWWPLILLFILILGKTIVVFIRQFRCSLEPEGRPVTMKRIAFLNTLMSSIYLLWLIS
ncbi:MAG: prenyltransferase, partial [Lachnospiraceae bacterium]